MKLRIILIIIICLVIILCMLLFLKLKKKRPISQIETFRYTYTSGYMVDSYGYFELNCDSNCKALIKPANTKEEDKKEITIDKQMKKKIENVLQKYNIEEWNGFNGNNKNVLDGDSFSLNITMKDKTSISASGYMKWPKNYGNFSREIKEMFLKLYEEHSPKQLELTYKISAGIPFKWEFEIEDGNIVEFVKSYVVKDENTNGKVGAPIYTNYVFKGLKEGETTIIFKYVNFVDNQISNEERRSVIVDKDKNISLSNEDE